MRSRAPLLALLLVWLGVAGCASAGEPGPRAVEGVFPAQGDIAALPVRVSDPFVLIRTVSIVAPNAVPEGVTQVAGRTDALYLHWIGGMCDRRAVLVLDRAADSIFVTVSTERDFGGCRMAGISRILMLELTEPVDASTVRLELLD